MTTEDIIDELRRENQELKSLLLGRSIERDEDFLSLVKIVCSAFRVPVRRALSRKRDKNGVHARRLIAAIWMETHTIDETRRRMKWKSLGHTSKSTGYALKLVEENENAIEALRNIHEKLPWLLGKSK